MNRGNRYCGCENDVELGPMNETRNTEDLPTFVTDVDLNRKGAATAATTPTVGVIVPSNPQSPQGPRPAAPPPSSFKATKSCNMIPATAAAAAAAAAASLVVYPNLEVGPFGEVRDPNRLPEFKGDVDDLNCAGSNMHPESSPFISTSNNDISGGTRRQHQATLPENRDTEDIKRSSPPAGPVTLSSVPLNDTKTKTKTKTTTNNSTTAAPHGRTIAFPFLAFTITPTKSRRSWTKSDKW
ncbi:hypothetical protein BGZ97_002837 [Linnemannia gamsii]|uniref:Uncharacterized protein n=1 Tax=Linnemannia gamsii TaxID=64522 RepID=A0A9P6QU70_9FUNG|nr:hypothetical protein BGZ97_002837 [Linnemannia gamsii]